MATEILHVCFEQHGIDGVKGILEYPLLRKTKEVILTDVDRDDIQVISKTSFR